MTPCSNTWHCCARQLQPLSSVGGSMRLVGCSWSPAAFLLCHCIHMLTRPVCSSFMRSPTKLMQPRHMPAQTHPNAILRRLIHCADSTVLCGNRDPTVRWPRSGQSSVFVLLVVTTSAVVCYHHEWSSTVPWCYSFSSFVNSHGFP